MGKFGKKNVVSTDLSRYHIGFMASSGFGKTSTLSAMAKKLYGDDGYIVLDMGAEDGVAAIDGVVSERVLNFGIMNEIVNDIVHNKDTDYPNLKLVIIDTLDAYFEIVEDYVIKSWNATNAGKPDFVKATSINPVEGGYGRGMDRVIDTAKKMIAKLTSVGVGVWWTAHVKEKDQTDLYTGKSFTTITANMSAKYFNAIKNSTHVVACGYYDRTMETVQVGKENPVTKKKKERSTIVNEVRKVKFRDDMLVADAKSRFAHIIDEIPLDRDLFIKAVEDAILAERSGDKTVAPPQRKIEAPSIVSSTSGQDGDDEVAITTAEAIEDDDTPPFDIEDEEGSVDRETLISEIRGAWKELSKETKARIKTIKGDVELDAASDEVLTQIKKIIEDEFQMIG